MLNKTLAAMFVVLMGIGMAGCNTVEGVGRDTQAVGEGIEDASQNLAP